MSTEQDKMDNNLLTIFYDDGESRGIGVGVSRAKGAGLDFIGYGCKVEKKWRR